MSLQKKFFSDLFDFSFTKFIAPKLIGLLYILGIIAFTLFPLFMLFSALISGEFVAILGALIFSPLLFLLNVIALRVALESIIIAFRTAENTARTAENTEYLKQP